MADDTVKAARNGGVSKQRKRCGQQCCVVGCRNRYGSKPSINLFSFPHENKDPARRKEWIQAVKRVNHDGSPWIPSKYAKVCSDHFVGGRPIYHPESAAYAPSIFSRKERTSLPGIRKGMVHCCVPNCHSHAAMKGISFHEIPVKPDELRSEWLRFISRGDWQPNARSNSSRVCSKHFRDKDYKQGLQRKRLQPNAKPSLYHPSSKKPRPKRRAITNCVADVEFPVPTLILAQNIKEDCEIQDHENTNVPPSDSFQKVEADLDMLVESAKEDCETRDGQCSAHHIYASVQFGSLKKVTIDRDTPVLKDIKEVCKVHNQQCSANHVNASVQVDSFHKVALNGDVDRYKRMYREALLAQEKARSELRKVRKELERYTKNEAIAAFETVLEDANSENPAAALIVDMIANYDKKHPSWSETMIRQCILWGSMDK